MIGSWSMMAGNCLEVMADMPAGYAHTVVTSPPYWNLRDYGIQPTSWADGWVGVLGLEPTPEAYVAHMVEVFRAHMVEVFRAVRRVLRNDGTLWLNIGDSFVTKPQWSAGRSTLQSPKRRGEAKKVTLAKRKRQLTPDGLKQKDLVGIPWMLAFALRADGWYLRSEVIWHKRAPMPESSLDRPTRSHEQIFLLAKSRRYFFDQVAASEPASGNAHHRGDGNNPKAAMNGRESRIKQNRSFAARHAGVVERRNMRTVWTLGAEGFDGAHFATMPTELVRKCLIASTSERGACAVCGAPWKRVTRKTRVATRPGNATKVGRASSHEDSPYNEHRSQIIGNRDPQRHVTRVETIGWKAGCQCEPAATVPAVVLDPFAGAGTVGVVARRLGLSFVGIDASPEYCQMGRDRIVDDAPLFNALEA